VVFTFYIYPPAQQDLLILHSTWSHLLALFSNVRLNSQNPYTAVSAGWASLPAYFAVSAADWLLLIWSAVLWLPPAVAWLTGWQRPRKTREVLLRAFYGAFGLIGLMSVIADVSGAINLNLQARLFPSFALVAAAVVAGWLVGHWPQRRIVRSALGLLFGAVTILSLFKATNEPLLSNKWLFYVPDEMSAIDWANAALLGRQLWVGYDERLTTASVIRAESTPSQARIIVQDERTLSTRDFLVSDVTRARAARLGQALPIGDQDLVTFDDGQSKVYHLRPLTPYQP